MSDDARDQLAHVNEERAMHGLDAIDRLPDQQAAEFFDAGDERHAKRRAKDVERAEQRRRAMVAAVMDTAQGRAWIWDLLVGCRVYAAILPTSGLAMAYAEGARSVGLAILADVQAAAADRYAEMVKEANDAATRVQ